MKGLIRQSSLNAFQELDRNEAQRLEEVWERVEEGSRDFLALKFPTGVLTFTVDADTDQVEVRCEEAEAFDSSSCLRVNAFVPWSSVIGKTFGWGWVAINQQGYQDGVLLSFDGLEPSVLLVAVASSLRVYAIKDVAT